MNKKRIIKPINSVIENDEYFYRHPEMYRANITDDVFDLNNFELKDNKNS